MLSTVAQYQPSSSCRRLIWERLARLRKSRRVIYLPELARTALTALRAESDSPSGFVFTSAAGTPLRKNNFLKRVFKPLLRQAELPDVTFRSLRHTANSLPIEAGEDPLAIAGSLGRSDTRMMFERYGHLFDHTARRVVQTADRIFAALEPNCRTIVENATLSLSIAAAVEKAKRPYRIRRLH